MNPQPRKNHAHGINLAVAQELSAERIARGWTLEALAAAIDGMSLRSVNRYLRGEAAIDVEDLDKICGALGASVHSVIIRAEKRLAEERARDEELRRRARTEAAARGVQLSPEEEADIIGALRHLTDQAPPDEDETSLTSGGSA